MSEVKKNAAKLSKKQIREEIATTLENTLIDLKGKLSGKKFKNNIKKASKILASGVSVKSVKSTPAPKKAAAKKMVAKKEAVKE